MSDSSKTKQQLIDELNALRAKMDPAGSSTAEMKGAAEGQTTGLTRRDVLAAWVAPIILTVPLMPRVAAAQPAPSPTFAPTTIPTPKPTPKPTTFPTSPNPTPRPSAFPTVAPTAVIPVELSEFEIE